MRVSRWVVVLLTMACNSTHGVPGIDAATPMDATPADAGPSTVNGTAVDTLHESPTKTSSRPEDLSSYVLQAYSADGSATGFQIIRGAGTADGKFSIPNVPDGSYYLLVHAPDDPVLHFYQTSSRKIDLGVDALGRRDTPPATASTTLALHLTGLAAPASRDHIFVDSYSTGRTSSQTLSFPPITTFDQTFEWNGTPFPLLDASRGDDLYVVHTGNIPIGAQNPVGEIRTIIDTYSINDVTLTDGQPTTVTGAFTAPTVAASHSFHLDFTAYGQGLDVTSHQPIAMNPKLRTGITERLSQGAPLVDIVTASLASNSTLDLQPMYLDPFPAAWPRFVTNFPFFHVLYTPRGSPRVAIYRTNTFERRALSGTSTSLAPLFAAPRGIKVNGLGTSHATAISFDGIHAVNVEWAPVSGVGHYIVTVLLLADDGANASLSQIATFDTSNTSLQMPATLFHIGDAYVIGVAAVVDGSTDYEHGTLRTLGFPYAQREAVTARLLFASSCGNGVVDAAFEECDSRGVTTAMCNADCTLPRCGDGIANTASGEACDDALDSLTCDTDCTVPSCGDGRINNSRGEFCDDVNTTPGDGCSAVCTVESGFNCTGEPSVCTRF